MCLLLEFCRPIGIVRANVVVGYVTDSEKVSRSDELNVTELAASSRNFGHTVGPIGRKCVRDLAGDAFVRQRR